jgi:FkbM family methyltransferase
MRLCLTFKKPLAHLFNYIRRGGQYPSTLVIKTKHGEHPVQLSSYHDLVTANEIFCRRSYPLHKESIVIDIGANIGLSALYFLAVNDADYVFLYEPNQLNTIKIPGVLKGFEGQYELYERAVAAKSGRFSFGLEPFGHYGGLTRRKGMRVSADRHQIDKEIIVDCDNINTVIEAVLAKHASISTIKLDTEGTEIATVAAISSEYHSRIERIVIEAQPRRLIFPNTFSQTQRGHICEFIRLQP